MKMRRGEIKFPSFSFLFISPKSLINRNKNIKTMLNKELIDPKDLEIRKLKNIISKFKKYDEERKAYYSESLKRLGELESYVQELEEDRTIREQKMAIRVTKQKEEINKLRTLIELQEIPEGDKEEFMSLVTVSNPELRKQNKALRKTVKEQKLLIGKLIADLSKK